MTSLFRGECRGDSLDIFLGMFNKIYSSLLDLDRDPTRFSTIPSSAESTFSEISQQHWKSKKDAESRDFYGKLSSQGDRRT